MRLNTTLIHSQKLTRKDVALVRRIHRKRKKLFKMIKYDLKKHNTSNLIDSARKLTNIEFELQRAWKFNELINMHSWWFLNPACSCPVMDNADFIGTDRKIYNPNCIVHGPINEQKEKDGLLVVDKNFSADDIKA